MKGAATSETDKYAEQKPDIEMDEGNEKKSKKHVSQQGRKSKKR